MTTDQQLNIRLFADGADKASILELYRDPRIQGFTTNPTLMRKAGISDYEAFARDLISCVPDRPLSFEVFADDADEMAAQAHLIASWGDNVYAKIPISNTRGESCCPLIHELSHAGVKVNVTAVMTLDQVTDSISALSGGAPAYISIFAGRIADTGRNPSPLVAQSVTLAKQHSNIEFIWASPRELLNVFEADSVGCHIITATPDVLKKLSLVGKDLRDYSLETVQMFYSDAVKAGYSLETRTPSQL